MEKRFSVEYENTPFLETSKTLAHPHRLNWRCEILLARNQEAIAGKRILDLASHDGRFSYACLKLGASHVTGIEGRQHLVESARENLTGLGYTPECFSFIQGDVFDYLNKVKPNEFDTVLCFGFFYHTVSQTDLLSEVKRIQATNFILDTRVASGIFIESPDGFVWTENAGSPPRIVRLVNSEPMGKLRHLVRIPLNLKKLFEQTANSRVSQPCLVFRSESHLFEGATIDPLGLVAWPTRSFIELAFKSYGFNFRELCWNRKEFKNWTALERYKRGERVSYIAQPVECGDTQ